MILKEEGLSERECVSIHSALTESLSFGKKHCKSGSFTGMIYSVFDIVSKGSGSSLHHVCTKNYCTKKFEVSYPFRHFRSLNLNGNAKSRKNL